MAIDNRAILIKALLAVFKKYVRVDSALVTKVEQFVDFILSDHAIQNK